MPSSSVPGGEGVLRTANKKIDPKILPNAPNPKALQVQACFRGSYFRGSVIIIISVQVPVLYSINPRDKSRCTTIAKALCTCFKIKKVLNQKQRRILFL